MHTPTCPVCQKPLDLDIPEASSNAPFCSERCRMIDLGSWLSGHYAIPTSEPMDLDPEEQNNPSDYQ